MSATQPVPPASPSGQPYVISRKDRWIILVIVLVVGWFAFRGVFAVVAAYRGVTFESQMYEIPAEHYYRKAIWLDPAVPDGWTRLGELYYFWNHGNVNRYADAASVFSQGTAAVPKDATLPFDLGRTYLLKLHDYKKAEVALRESVRRDPTKEFAWDYLAYAALKNGNRAFAMECWRHVLRINPNHDSARKALERYGS